MTKIICARNVGTDKFGHRSQVLDLGSKVLVSRSWVLRIELESQILCPGSWFMGCRSQVSGSCPFSGYYKVLQKILTKYVRYYKVWQEVTTKCNRYYKRWQLLQSDNWQCESIWKTFALKSAFFCKNIGTWGNYFFCITFHGRGFWTFLVQLFPRTEMYGNIKNK